MNKLFFYSFLSIPLFSYLLLLLVYTANKGKNDGSRMVMERYRADMSFESDFGSGGGGINAISHLYYRRIGRHPMYD